MELRDGAPG